MKGFYHKVLEIDMTKKSSTVLPVEEDILEQYLGVKGLATHLLLQHTPAGVDPFAPENRLIFSTGPVCNSPVWGGSRYGVFTKSPQTGLYCESYSGGKTPEAIDSCAFDAIIIHGRAGEPTVLSITEEGAAFLDGTHLWGKDAFYSETALREMLSDDAAKKKGVVTIGPAGEKGIPYAMISNDYWRQAGRGGAGAVMGSKHLKGILFQGSAQREFADLPGLKDYYKAFIAANSQSPGAQAYKSRGTTQMVAVMNSVEAFPTRYWSAGSCEHWEKISGDRYHEEHDIKPNACAKCFIACGRMATISRGRHTGLVLEGPEYETIYTFGGLCMIDDMGEIAYLNDLCDRLGLDTISAGNLVAFAMEATEQGKLDGPTYGDADAAAKLLEEMVSREGTGNIFSQGIVQAAATLGMEDQAVHVKGMEPAGYEPRTLKGVGLAYAVSDRGACHLRTTFYKPELAGLIPPDQIEGKAEMLIDYEDRLSIFDCLVLCRFYRDMYTWEELAKLVQLMTGLAATPENLKQTGSRVTELAREFNLREGMTPEADTLPKQFHKPLPTGQVLTEKELDTLLDEYYALKGWKR